LSAPPDDKTHQSRKIKNRSDQENLDCITLPNVPQKHEPRKPNHHDWQSSGQRVNYPITRTVEDETFLPND
jgi:hypothetical protein